MYFKSKVILCETGNSRLSLNIYMSQHNIESADVYIRSSCVYSAEDFNVNV